MSQEKTDTKKYVSILSEDGTFRLPVAEGTPEAVKRKWSVDGKTGVKNELVYKAMTGKITNVTVEEVAWGTQLQIDLTDEAGTLTISTSTKNNFGTDLMKKLPSMDVISKDYRLSPYSFIGDNEKPVKGVSITDNDVKVENFFYDGKNNINGFPEPEEGIKELTGAKRTNAWKKYFMDVESFLVDYTIEKITPLFATKAEDDKEF